MVLQSGFPEKVTLQLTPPEEGLAVDLCFEARSKNSLHFTLFSDPNGRAEIAGEVLLQTFDEERTLFIMDYDDPRSVFTGRITARVLSRDDVRGAQQAFEMYKGICSFPSGYAEKLRIAATKEYNPSGIDIVIEAK